LSRPKPGLRSKRVGPLTAGTPTGTLREAIDQRNSTEELLPEGAGFTRTIIATALDAIVVMDQRERILEFNPAAERLFGYRREEVLGRELADTLIPPSSGKQYRSGLAHFLATGEGSMVGKRVDVVGMRADGSEVPVELSVTPTGLRTPAFVGFLRDITERKRAEEALRQSEEQFRNLANSAAVMLWMSGPDKLCTWVNAQWLTFVGHAMEQELGNGWAESIHPEDFDRCLQTYATSFDAREPFSMEYRLRRHDGQWRWILDNGTPRYDAHKNFTGYIGSCVDVTSVKLLEEQRVIAERKLRQRGRALLETRTERRRLDQSLRQRDQELAVLFDHSPDSLVRFDSNIRATHVNAAFESATGISSKDIVGRSIRELPVPAATVKAVESLVRSVLTTGQTQTAYFPYPTLQGIREFEVRSIPEFAADQSIAAVFSIARDITERSTAERALRQREQELATLFDNSPDAIVRLDRNLRHLYVNATWERLMGISREAALGKTSQQLGLPQTAVRHQRRSIRAVLKTGSPLTADFTYPSPRGPVDCEVRHIPEFGDGGVTSILLIGRDVTEQKSLQRLAAAKERDIRALTISLMTAGEQERRRVARDIHDSLCQHLGALAAEIGNMTADVPASSAVGQRLRAARKHALSTAEEARQIARQLHPAILEDLGLPKALQNLCEEFSRQLGIPVSFKALGPRRVVPIEASSCVYRIAQEALNNIARHAGAKSVAVLLTVRRDLHFSIRDDGVGFDPEAVQGAGGLGLVGMRERARLAHGELSVDAKPGQGTCVRLLVPLPGGSAS